MKKVLFVCHANVGRSQAAMELYRARGGQADSAGTEVDRPGTTLGERPSSLTIASVMYHDYGIDMSQNIRTQLTEEQARDYDKIVMIAERDTVPDWAFHDARVEFWDVQDSKGQDTPTTRRIVHQLAGLVDAMPVYSN